MQKKIIYLCVLLSATIWVSACSNLRFPAVYRIDVPQGNIITDAMLQKLKPNMTPQQVRFVLGTPLVRDTFHPSTWVYHYYVRKGKDNSEEKKQVRVYFNKQGLFTHHDIRLQESPSH